MDIRKHLKIKELESAVIDPWFKEVNAQVSQFNKGDFSIAPFSVKNESIITWGSSLLFNDAIEEDDNTIDEVSISVVIQLQENNLQLSCDVALGAKLLYFSVKENLDDLEIINSDFLSQFLNEIRTEVVENAIRGIKLMRNKSLNEL